MQGVLVLVVQTPGANGLVLRWLLRGFRTGFVRDLQGFSRFRGVGIKVALGVDMLCATLHNWQ